MYYRIKCYHHWIALWFIGATICYEYLYGKEFESVILLNLCSEFGVIAHGFGNFFNRYLGANGQGKALRNSAIIVGGCTMILNLLLYLNGVKAVLAYSKLASGFVYLILMLTFIFNL